MLGAAARVVAEVGYGGMSVARVTSCALLGRLERLGLIVNYGAGQAKGKANAWGLTPKGREVDAALSPSYGD
jgi:hypothetical protein